MDVRQDWLGIGSTWGGSKVSFIGIQSKLGAKVEYVQDRSRVSLKGK